MARVLIVGGGCPGRVLAAELVSEGHAVRVTTRDEGRRKAIEAAGAECRIAHPRRMGPLRAALDGVAVVCWLLAGAEGKREEVRALHGRLLEHFLRQVVDTTVRGFIYDATPGALPAGLLQEGSRIVRSAGERNAIPVSLIACWSGDEQEWVGAARAAVRSLLTG